MKDNNLPHLSGKISRLAAQKHILLIHVVIPQSLVGTLCMRV